jgi:exonuclease 1
LRQENIEFIVAPYEADAQLAFLSRTGVVDCVISEDADLLIFGCAQVMFKMDDNGKGKLIRMARLKECRSPLNLHNFSFKMFRQMCILSGCDYLEPLKGIRVKKAYDAIEKYGTAASVSVAWICRYYSHLS